MQRESDRQRKSRTYAENRERFKAMRDVLAEMFPERQKARDKVKNEIRHGRMTPGPCSRCGRSDVKTQAHHHDYSKPLDVEWICRRCHGLEHGVLNHIYKRGRKPAWRVEYERRVSERLSQLFGRAA